MRKIITTLAIVLISSQAFSQKLVKNETDRFTKSFIKETSLEVLAMPFVNALRFRFKSVNGNMSVFFKLSIHHVFRIDEGDNIYLLLANDQSVKLTCSSGKIADKLLSDGSLWNAEAMYDISQDDIKRLSESPIVSVRIEISESYVTFNKVKEKNYQKFIKSISLIQ